MVGKAAAHSCAVSSVGRLTISVMVGCVGLSQAVVSHYESLTCSTLHPSGSFFSGVWPLPKVDSRSR